MYPEKLLKNKILYTAAFVIALMLFLLKTFYDAGEFKTLRPHSDYRCQKIEGIPGGEDIELDRHAGKAYISSDSRRDGMPGSIYQYNYGSENPELKNITGSLPFEFHPHGISIYPKNGRAEFLFAVNHRKEMQTGAAGHFIEVFSIQRDGLKHLRSLENALLTSPNDIAAVDEEKFYVSNDHGTPYVFTHRIEDYLQLSLSNIIYFDGNNFRKAADSISYANGINLSRDQKILYAASSVAGQIKVYDRSPAGGDLLFRENIDLNTGADNIDIDEDGNLWVGCHPRLLTFVRHARDRNVLSPSQVVKVTIEADGRYSVNETYLNTGEDLSASSVGAAHAGRLFIGPVFDSHILDCRKKLDMAAE